MAVQSTDIRFYLSSQKNAPQLSNRWGCMIDVLDACLLTGFGSQIVSSLVVQNGVARATFGGAHGFMQFQVVKIDGASNAALNGEFKVLGVSAATLDFVVDLPDQSATGTITCSLAPLGWSKPFSGTQKAVYQAKDKTANPYFLRVDNACDPVYATTYAKFAKVGILATCNGIDDISGTQTPYDESAPNKNWLGTESGSTAKVGWYKWQYAVHDNAAVASNWFENEGATNGNRPWVLIGTKDSFYLLNESVVTNSLIIPNGFVVIQHNNKAKPFLLATNRYGAADTSVKASTPLGDMGLSEVAGLVDYVNNTTPSTQFGLISGFGVRYSGAQANTLKSDQILGYLLSPVYLLDSTKYILGALPIVQSCPCDATSVANYQIYADQKAGYIACKYRSATGGTPGVLFFKIYEGT